MNRKARRAALEASIIALLDARREPLSVSEVWREVRPAAPSDQAVRHVLDDLARRGEVRRLSVTRAVATGHGYATNRARTATVSVFTTAAATTEE